MTDRSYTDAVTRELEAWPGATARYDTSGKHDRVILTFGARERFVVFPKSPSDSVRGVHNFMGDVRASLRALGAVRVERKSRTERRQRAKAPPRAPTLPVITDPRPDGFAALRELHARMAAQQAPPPAQPAARPSLLRTLFGLWRRAA